MGRREPPEVSKSDEKLQLQSVLVLDRDSSLPGRPPPAGRVSAMAACRTAASVFEGKL